MLPCANVNSPPALLVHIFIWNTCSPLLNAATLFSNFLPRASLTTIHTEHGCQLALVSINYTSGDRYGWLEYLFQVFLHIWLIKGNLWTFNQWIKRKKTLMNKCPFKTRLAPSFTYSAVRGTESSNTEFNAKCSRRWLPGKSKSY